MAGMKPIEPQTDGGERPIEGSIAFLGKKSRAEFRIETDVCGGAAIDKHGVRGVTVAP